MATELIQLRATIEAADNVAFVTTDLGGKDTRVQGFSPGAEKVFGYTSEEILGQRVAILHPFDVIEGFPEMQKAIREGSKGHSGETTLVRKSGERFPALLTIHPLYDDSGALIGTLGVSIDITDRKHAEERVEELLRMQTALLDNIPGCIAMILKKGSREIVASNKLAQGIGAVPGKTCFETCASIDNPCSFCLA